MSAFLFCKKSRKDCDSVLRTDKMTGAEILKHQDIEWVIELNNPDKYGSDFEFENLKDYIKKLYPNIIYFCYGKEIGAKGTPHYHIYLINESRLYGSATSKKFKNAHVELVLPPSVVPGTKLVKIC